jgi:hypothetical protein
MVTQASWYDYHEDSLWIPSLRSWWSLCDCLGRGDRLRQPPVLQEDVWSAVTLFLFPSHLVTWYGTQSHGTGAE